jgi:LmbE family N-acetylglucosaminyl deacetylase
MTGRLTPPPPPRRSTAPPARGRVLVFAPHPDDETIGIGGTLAMHVAAGDPVAAIFLTAGTSGDPTGAIDKIEYAALREREARAAAQVIGISHLEFWGFPDNFEVTASDVEAIVPRVVDAIARLAPDVIYAPHRCEQHSDHHATAIILERALARIAAITAPSAMPAAYGYEVWSASLAECVVDVSESYPVKLAALRCYGSQLEHTDIERFIGGLNAYRAVFLAKGARYGEALVPIEPAS